MKAPLENSHRAPRKSSMPARSRHRFCPHGRGLAVKEVQMIYAHFGPPVVFTVAEPFKHVVGWADA